MSHANRFCDTSVLLEALRDTIPKSVSIDFRSGHDECHTVLHIVNQLVGLVECGHVYALITLFWLANAYTSDVVALLLRVVPVLGVY